MDDSVIFEFKDIYFSFFNKKHLFKNLSLKLKSGTFYLVKGNSGVGKTTFLRLMNRLEIPLAGEMYFKNNLLKSYYTPNVRRSILYIQQTPTVTKGSVRDNLLLPFNFKNNQKFSKPDENLMKSLMNDFLLGEINLDENATNLSVGQLQRICFMRGLLLSPDILLLDEPTSALDQKASGIIESAAETLCMKSGKTVVMVSHKEYEPEQTILKILEIADGVVREI